MSTIPHTQALEAILFTLTKPVSYTKLAKWLGISADEVRQVAEDLAKQAEVGQRGIMVSLTNTEVQLTTSAAAHEVVAQVVKDERTGELTKPSLETLAIIAYRSPIAKAELEAIRGVNCTLILRNLLIRGLVSEQFDKTKAVEVYDITPEYLQLLGVQSVADLPEYDRLHRDIELGNRLALLEKPGDFFAAQVTSDTADQPTTNPDGGLDSAE